MTLTLRYFLQEPSGMAGMVLEILGVRRPRSAEKDWAAQRYQTRRSFSPVILVTSWLDNDEID